MPGSPLVDLGVSPLRFVAVGVGGLQVIDLAQAALVAGARLGLALADVQHGEDLGNNVPYLRALQLHLPRTQPASAPSRA